MTADSLTREGRTAKRGAAPRGGTRRRTFGAFVELLPGKDGLLHISRVAQGRVDKVEDVLNIGDEVKVRVSGIDSQGRVNLVRADMVIEEKPRAPRHDRGERRDRGDRGEGPKPNYPFRSNGNRRREHSEE